MMIARKLVAWFPSCAGLFGALGVGVSAAAAHVAGGGPAATAGQFLLFHAAALLGLGVAENAVRLPVRAAAGGLLAVGTLLFCGALALAGLWSWRPWPTAAPLGGLMLIAGWLVLAAGAFFREPARGGGA